MSIPVTFGAASDFNHLIFGQKAAGTLQYLERQMTNFSETLTEAGRSFFTAVPAIYEKFNGAEAMRLARNAMQKAGSVFQRDEVWRFDSIGQVQNAKFVMQRWVMAQPTVRQMYHEQRCSGYEDTYVDVQPGRIGEDHYDYRRVMDGVVRDDPTEEGGWTATVYIDDIHEGDRELTHDEKTDILSVWDLVETLMKNGERDPTSAMDNKL